MNKKTFYLYNFFTVLFVVLCGELIYLNITKSIDQDAYKNKNSFVKTSGLPDLAVSTEAMYIRHRSLSDVFSVFKDDALLTEYFPSTFSISHSHILNNTPSKILHEK